MCSKDMQRLRLGHCKTLRRPAAAICPPKAPEKGYAGQRLPWRCNGPLINPNTQHMCPSVAVGIYQRLSESIGIALKLELSNKYALAAGAPPMQRMITGLVCGPHL